MTDTLLIVGVFVTGWVVAAVTVFFTLYGLCSLERWWINRSIRRAFKRQQAAQVYVLGEWGDEIAAVQFDWDEPPVYGGLR